MDFGYSPEQRELLNAVETLIARRLPPEETRRRDAEGVPPYDLLPDYARMGILGLPFGEEYGGMGDRWSTLTLVLEHVAKLSYSAASIISRVVAFGGMSLCSYGTEAQRREILPDLIGGRALFALAVTEPQAGSDAAAIRTRAERIQGGWRITGHKAWISDADAATHLVVAARSQPGSSGADGISLFLVPRRTEGISMTELGKIGNNCMPSYDIFFDEVLVGSDALMGAEGKGFRQVLSTLHFSRAAMAATTTGSAQSAVDMTLSHARQRFQFGRPIGANQAVRHRLADMQMRVDQSRLAVWHLAWLISENIPCRRQAAQAKVIATEALQYVTHHGMQIFGSAGYSASSDIQRLWRDARLYTFGEGSNEILRDLIAKELGL